MDEAEEVGWCGTTGGARWRLRAGGVYRGCFGGADVRMRVGLENSVIGAEWSGETDGGEGSELGWALLVRRSR